MDVEFLHKDFGRAYSSGSVQDFHLIPFSSIVSKHNWNNWHQNFFAKIEFKIKKWNLFNLNVYLKKTQCANLRIYCLFNLIAFRIKMLLKQNKAFHFITQ